MRLTLDTARNLVLALPSDSSQPDPLHITLGDPAFELVLPAGQAIEPAGNVGPVSESVEFVAKTVVSGSIILSGAVTVEDEPDSAAIQTLVLDEDWTSAALVALFSSTTETVDLLASWRWKSGDDTEWTRTPWITIRVQNSLFPSVIVPGAVVLADQLYISSITDYTGSDATALDYLATISIPLGTVVRIVTDNGESAWKLIEATDETNVDEGTIQPLDYDGVTNIRNWTRVAGL